MNEALKEAVKALNESEVPVGAVIVQGEKIIAAAHNMRETKKNALYHAEILAIDMACKVLDSWRLLDTVLYVTLEPCPMCAGAIIQARIPRVVFGAYDEKAGSIGSKLNLFYDYSFNHTVSFVGGVMEDECKNILKVFFEKKR